MKQHHDVADVHFEGDVLHVTIDGRARMFNIHEISQVLLHTFEISPSGYGIHWPLLDEDVSIDGLLGIVHVPSKKLRSGLSSLAEQQSAARLKQDYEQGGTNGLRSDFSFPR